MYGRVTTVAFVGVEARPVEVEVQVTPGQATFSIVGLPDKAVAESRERVRNALHAVGFGLPWKHITVNLAPGDLPKEGSHYDLPIALALMVATGALAQDPVGGFVAVGELGLDASLRPVPGALPAAIGAAGLGKGMICPAECGPEAAWAGDEVQVLAPSHLLSLINHLRGEPTLRRPEPNVKRSERPLLDLKDVRGQETAKRALEIAAAGGHNLLMIGPPGAGKTMLAERLPSILPPLDAPEMLEVSMIQSLAGELLDGRIATDRPFRAPHHSASMAALVGGGSRPRLGEVSLAHLGVLFLDELPEFPARVLDALRQPLETGESVIARANHRVTYPARFQLITAMNPCRCGNPAPGRACARGPRCAAEYQSRLSGPLLERIDIQVELPAVSAAELSLPPAREGSASVRSRVSAARERQKARFASLGREGVRLNAQAQGQVLEEIAKPDAAGLALLEKAALSLGLSARGFHRTLKVARTIADLGGARDVERQHIAEALSYRGELRTQPGSGAAAQPALTSKHAPAAPPRLM